MGDTAIYQRSVEILQNLIRFNTTNPPGNEAECIQYIAELLRGAGLEPDIFVLEEPRQNLVCRLPGKGEAPPLMLYGHVDVVTTAGQNWSHDPFAGEIADGYVWGRGAIDMKGELTMFLTAFMRMKAEGITPAGDILFVALSDEEAISEYGAAYMVEEHAEVFDGGRYALGEFGAFSMYLAGKRFYPIQVAEKQACKLELTVRGAGGHGAAVVPGNAMEELGKVLKIISTKRLPVHITPVTHLMFTKISESLPFPLKHAIRLLLKPSLTDWVLGLLGEEGLLFAPLFHNTVNPTIVRGGEKDNVVPTEVKLQLDGRLLPGFTPSDLVQELGDLLSGLDVEIEVLGFEECPSDVDMGLFSLLENVMLEMDSEGVPIPMQFSAVTDARHFSKLGIQSYGFTPMQLERGSGFFAGLHGPDERIPVEALTFGSEAVYRVLQQYKG
jgi:acetylornithine deacetylase/succinyl-diaminopimelate desuccinylase-like protein